MSDNPRSPSSSSKANRTIRAQKISLSSSTSDQRNDESTERTSERAPPTRSHTPGHLSSKSHGGSSERKRKTSESSIRQRSQSVATKTSVPSQTSSVPLPSNLKPNGDKPPDPQSGPLPSSNASSVRDSTDSRRPLAMRSTSAIVSKANTSSMSTSASTAPPSRSRASVVPKLKDREGPYVPMPPLQDPNTAPDVPAAPTSGMYWSRAPTSGAPHSPLRAHTTTLVGSNMFVFGGCDSRTCFNELYVLDADSFHWSNPQVFGDVPVPLRAMTCTAINNKRLVVFGGGDGPAYYNDVYVLDTVNFRWHRPRIVSSEKDRDRDRDRDRGGGGGGTSNNGGGAAPAMPSPRRAHTACLYKNGIYVFGGGDGVRALNDIWRLDVSDPNKMSWKLISPSIPSSSSSKGDSASGSKDSNTVGVGPAGAKAPRARGYHTANMVGSKLIVFGGSDGGECFNDVWVYDVEARVWRAVHVPVTFRRLSHTSTLVGSYLFVVGGHDGAEYSNEVLLLNLVTMAWDRRRVYGLPPTGRGYHGVVLHDSRLIMTGGFDGSEVFGDVWILELAVHAYYSQISHFTIEV